LHPVSDTFLASLLYDPEDGGDMLLRIIKLTSGYLRTTRHYIPEDSSTLHSCRRDNLKSSLFSSCKKYFFNKSITLLLLLFYFYFVKQTPQTFCIILICRIKAHSFASSPCFYFLTSNIFVKSWYMKGFCRLAIIYPPFVNSCISFS
jgi:hypothetical protein